MSEDRIDAAVQALLDGKIKFHEVEGLTGNDSVEASRVRRRFLEKKFGMLLKRCLEKGFRGSDFFHPGFRPAYKAGHRRIRIQELPFQKRDAALAKGKVTCCDDRRCKFQGSR